MFVVCVVISQKVRLIVSSKCIFDLFELFVVDQYVVEVVIVFGFVGQIVVGGEDDVLMFGNGDVGVGVIEIVVVVLVYFDENQCFVIVVNQVDFVVMYLEIVFYNVLIVVFKIVGCLVFGFVVVVCGGIVGFCLYV